MKKKSFLQKLRLKHSLNILNKLKLNKLKKIRLASAIYIHSTYKFCALFFLCSFVFALSFVSCKKNLSNLEILGNWILLSSDFESVNDDSGVNDDSSINDVKNAERTKNIFATISFVEYARERASEHALSGASETSNEYLNQYKKKLNVSGFSGVNNFSCTANITESTAKKNISFENIVSTMMAGEHEKEKFEKDFFDLLNNAERFSIEHNDERDILKIYSNEIFSNQNNAENKKQKSISFYKFHLENTSWKLSAFQNENAVESILDGASVPEITFTQSEDFYGFTGVNQLMGKYSASNESRKISFAELGTTRMASQNDYAGMLESQYIFLLEKANKFLVSANQKSLNLILLDENENTLLVFENGEEQ